MLIPIEWAVVIFIILLGILIYVYQLRAFSKMEGFNNADEYAQIKMIVTTYEQLLKRPPSADELSQFKLRNLSQSDLEDILLNSDEYGQNSKIETNSPQADFLRINSERYVIAHITAIYQTIKHAKTPPQIILPLRDMYVYFVHDDEKFRNFLLADLYSSWEVDVISNIDTNWQTQSTVDIYNRYYNADNNGAHQAFSKGQININSRTFTPVDKSTENLDFDSVTPVIVPVPANVNNAALDVPNYRDNEQTNNQSDSIIFDRPTVLVINNNADAQTALQALGYINGQATAVTSVSAAPVTNTINTTNTTNTISSDPNVTSLINNIVQTQSQTPVKKLYFNPQRDMVLRPEYEWSVPMQAPPVCTPLPGMAAIVQPLMDQTALIGTPLLDASNTQIMPSADYQQYYTQS